MLCLASSGLLMACVDSNVAVKATSSCVSGFMGSGCCAGMLKIHFVCEKELNCKTFQHCKCVHREINFRFLLTEPVAQSTNQSIKVKKPINFLLQKSLKFIKLNSQIHRLLNNVNC